MVKMNTSATTHTPEEADQLLKQAARGDTQAFARLITLHKRMVFGIAFNMVQDRAAAEDISQDVFLQLYQNLDKLESGAHLLFWLRRVVGHRSLDQARRVIRWPWSGWWQDRQSHPGHESQLLADSQFRQLLQRLPAQQKLVMTLRYQEDLEPAEIAEVLELPVNTVKSQLQRALATLRAQLDKPSGDTHGL